MSKFTNIRLGLLASVVAATTATSMPAVAQQPKKPNIVFTTDQPANCLPNCGRIVVAGSSHTVPSESPEARGRDVLAFLGKH